MRFLSPQRSRKARHVHHGHRPTPKERGSGEKGGSVYQLLWASCRSQATQVPRITARGGGAGTGPGPCAHPAGCEKFSWVLFIVSIIRGNEDSAIRTQLAVVLGTCEAEQNPRSAGGQACLPEVLKAPLGTSGVM